MPAPLTTKMKSKPATVGLHARVRLQFSVSIFAKANSLYAMIYERNNSNHAPSANQFKGLIDLALNAFSHMFLLVLHWYGFLPMIRYADTD